MKRAILVSIALFSLVMARENAISAILSDLKTGKITSDDAALYLTYTAVDPSQLPFPYSTLELPKCATPAIVAVRQMWQELSPSVQMSLQEMLARPTGLPETHGTTHFLIHYTTSGPNAVTAAYAQAMATNFENAWTELVTTRRYTQPPSDGTAGGDNRYDIYIMQLSGGVLGYTSPEAEVPSTPWPDATSYIVMRTNYSGFGYPPDQLCAVTAHHEFFHAVQMSYDYSEQVWFMECSSTWIEDEVYPSLDAEQDYLSYLLDSPWLSITTYDGQHEYATYIWGTHLSQVYGDSVMRKIWESCKNATCMSAFQSVLSGYGSGRNKAFMDFFTWNYLTGSRYISGAGLYVEGAEYPLATISRTHGPSAGAYPASGTSPNPPEIIGCNYIVFKIPSGATGPFSVIFDGADGTTWGARLVVRRSTSYRNFDFTLNANGYGTVSLADSQYNGAIEVILIAGNLSTSGNSANFQYYANFETIAPTYEPPRNLVAESGHDGYVPLTWLPPISGGTYEELFYDNGTPAGYIPRTSGYGTVVAEYVRFTASMSCTLKAIKIYAVYPTSEVSRTFDVYVWPDNGGWPDFLNPVYTNTINPNPSDWTEINIPSPGIYFSAGDFYIGVTRSADNDPAPSVDDGPEIEERSIAIIDSSAYTIGGNYLIRAQVVYSGSLALMSSSMRPLHLYRSLEPSIINHIEEPVETFVSPSAVTGYKVYRSRTPGTGYTFLASTTNTYYDDHTVINDSSYYYVVTAIYDGVHESGYSNEANAVPTAGGGGGGTGGDTLSHDDGSTGSYLPSGSGEKYAVVFEPTQPCRVLGLLYQTYYTGSGYGMFLGEVLTWNGNRIGEPIFQQYGFAMLADPNGWVYVDASVYEVYVPGGTGGGFAVSFGVLDTEVNIIVDDTDDDYSWWYAPEYGWMSASLRFHIRAVVQSISTGERYTISGYVSLTPGTGGVGSDENPAGSIVRVVELGKQALTDSSGFYRIDSVPAGVYSVTAWHPGFQESRRSNVPITQNTTMDFSLLMYSQPLNEPRGFCAYNYEDGRIILNWLAPFGQPGTMEELHYDAFYGTYWYDSSAHQGDIYDTWFDIGFPCTLAYARAAFYDPSGIYNRPVSVHLWFDDGTGYPDFSRRICDSVVISSQVNPLTSDSMFTKINFPTPVVLWPGQRIHFGIRKLYANPAAMLMADTVTHYDPPVSLYYNRTTGMWFTTGELLMRLVVKYFADESEIPPGEIIPSKPPRQTFPTQIGGNFIPLRRIDLYRASMITSSARVNRYEIFRATTATGPFASVGLTDTLYFIDSTVTNGQVYYYTIAAWYDLGRSEMKDTIPAIALAWNDTAWVLLVDDDGSSYYNSFPDEGVWWAKTLLELGIPFNAVDLLPEQYISSSALGEYQAVIWECGANYTWPIVDSAEYNLANYLDNGGKLALFGQDYLWARHYTSVSGFPATYLGLTGVSHDTFTISDVGSGTSLGTVRCKGFFGNITYGVTNSYYPDSKVYPDQLTYTAGADSVIRLMVSGRSVTAGVKYESGDFKTIFSTISPYCFTEVGTQKREFVRRILIDYFDVHGGPITRTFSLQLFQGWNLVSVPVVMDNMSTASVFSSATVYAYDPSSGTFYTPDTISPGVGYFVFTITPDTRNLNGIPIDTLEKTLTAGWNAIGTPWLQADSTVFSDIDFSPFVVMPEVWELTSAGYMPRTTLRTGKGYMIFSIFPCTMRIPGH